MWVEAKGNMKLRHEQGGEDGAAGDSPERAAARAFIAATLPAKPAPGLPEVSIHTATPASGLREVGPLSGSGICSDFVASV